MCVEKVGPKIKYIINIVDYADKETDTFLASVVLNSSLNTHTLSQNNAPLFYFSFFKKRASSLMSND